MPIQVQEASRTPDLTKLELPHDVLSLKQQAQRIKIIEGCKIEKTNNIQR
jgi:hypothetical protein